VAAKIVRQPNQIVLLGAPSSAAAMSQGHERSPAALRAAGLIESLTSIGYQVHDLGDNFPALFQPDDESPRARNIPRILKALDELKPRVEQAVKSGGLPLVLTGDCTMALALIAGMRRYFRIVSLIYFDSDADLNVPATSPSGCVDGMVVSHLTGRGAAELVRFWGEPPLVREPDLALFGVHRLDPPEDELLSRSPLRRYLAGDVRRMGPAAAAKEAIDRVHGQRNEFALHFDVDVISGFRATNYAAEGGLSLDEIREALQVFVREPHLAAIEVAAYNPELDPDGSGARIIVDLLTFILETRLKAQAPPVPAQDTDQTPTMTPPATEPFPAAPVPPPASTAEVAPGEASSSDLSQEPSPPSDNARRAAPSEQSPGEHPDDAAADPASESPNPETSSETEP
jgi:arginase